MMKDLNMGQEVELSIKSETKSVSFLLIKSNWDLTQTNKLFFKKLENEVHT